MRGGRRANPLNEVIRYNKLRLLRCLNVVGDETSSIVVVVRSHYFIYCNACVY